MRTIYKDELRQPMSYTFPAYNVIPFEEHFSKHYIGCDTDRYYLDVWWTNYMVDHGYATDIKQVPEIQAFVDSLDKNKKYFTICQYDHGILADVSDLDVLQFNMSVDKGICLPLICTPHEKRFYENRVYKASFVGCITHPIRTKMMEAVKGMEGCLFSTDVLDYTAYTRILAKSVFALCPRGVGLSSFRCYSESMFQGAIPVYITDIALEPFGIDFNEYGVLVKEKDVKDLPEIINSFTQDDIIRKQKLIVELYGEYFSFVGCFNQIIKYLESE